MPRNDCWNIATAWFDVSRFTGSSLKFQNGKGEEKARAENAPLPVPSDFRSEVRTSVTAVGVEKVKEKANKREGHHEIDHEGAKRAIAVSRSARIDRAQLARDAVGNEGVQFHSQLRRFRFIISRPSDDRRRHGAINRTTIHDAQPSDRSDRFVTEIISLQSRARKVEELTRGDPVADKFPSRTRVGSDEAMFSSRWRTLSRYDDYRYERVNLTKLNCEQNSIDLSQSFHWEL